MVERYVKAKGKNISSQSRRTREPDHDYANTISFDSAWDFLGNHQGDVCVTFYRFFSVCVPVWVGVLAYRDTRICTLVCAGAHECVCSSVWNPEAKVRCPSYLGSSRWALSLRPGACWLGYTGIPLSLLPQCRDHKHTPLLILV